MKTSSLKSSTIVLTLNLVITLLVLQSCKSASPIVVSALGISAEQSVSHTTDTIYRHDSVYVREVMRGDTVYLTRTEWRDRWRTRLVHDTVRHTEYVDRVVEKPPERYVPKFHKWCTGLFWVIVAIFILYVAFRIVIKVYARR